MAEEAAPTPLLPPTPVDETPADETWGWGGGGGR